MTLLFFFFHSLSAFAANPFVTLNCQGNSVALNVAVYGETTSAGNDAKAADIEILQPAPSQSWKQVPRIKSGDFTLAFENNELHLEIWPEDLGASAHLKTKTLSADLPCSMSWN